MDISWMLKFQIVFSDSSAYVIQDWWQGTEIKGCKVKMY